MPLKLKDGETLAEEPKSVAERKLRPVFDPLKLIEETDEQTLVLALVATNPALDDLLPDDPKLRADLDVIRSRIAQRQLALNTDAGEIKNVIHQHVHVHLWDENTQDRLKSLGRSMIDFVVMAKDKVMEAKVALIDNDDRNTITYTEFFGSFKDSFSSMVGFMRGKDFGKPHFGSDEDENAVIEPAEFAEDMGSFFPDREEDQHAAVRLISAAMGEPLDAQLEEVKDTPPSAPEATDPGKKKPFQLRTMPDGPGM